MPGTLALVGGGPFQSNDDLDRRLLSAAGADRVVVLPTADAFEGPETLIADAMSWAERLDVQIEALMVFQREEAMDPGAAEIVSGARAVYLVGDNPMHLRSTLKDTPIYDALGEVLAGGGVVCAVAGSAAALCDPMLDQRGGAFTLGLGLVTGVAVVPEVEQESEERRTRTLELADTPVIELPTGSAALRIDGTWELVGDAVVHGELASARPAPDGP